MMQNNLLAQTEHRFGNPLQGIGPLGVGDANSPSLFNRFLSGVIGIMTAIAAIWFVFLLLTGAIGILTSGGDKAAYESARKKITTGLIGIIVVIASIFVVDLVGNLLGIPNILDPGAFVQSFNF